MYTRYTILFVSLVSTLKILQWLTLRDLAVPCSSAVCFPLEAAAQTAIYIGGGCGQNPELSCYIRGGEWRVVPCCQGLRKECTAADAVHAVHMDLLQLCLTFMGEPVHGWCTSSNVLLLLGYNHYSLLALLSLF